MHPTVLHAYPVWLSQTQTWMYSQVAELQRLGLDTHVVCERTTNLEQFGVPNLHCLRSERLLTELWHRCLRKLRLADRQNYAIAIGRRIGAAVLHSHFGDVAWGNLGAARALKAKHVVTFYGFDVQKLPTEQPTWRDRYRELFREADLLLCEGSHMEKCIVELGAPSRKVKVQHLGVDVQRFAFSPRRWSAGQPLRVLIAASFRQKKGIPYAVEALGLLNRTLPVELTIIGDAGPDPAHRNEKQLILDAIERSGLAEKTRLLGYQPYAVMLREAYAHHVFIQPSVTADDGDTEGGAPVAIIEMLATGMPVVSTRHCDIPEVMGPLSSELLAPERDVHALHDILLQLIRDPQRWANLALMGRRRIENEYDLGRQVRQLASWYAAITQQAAAK